MALHRDHRKVALTSRQATAMRGATISGLRRVGKVLCIETNHGDLVCGAGMSGYWRWIPAPHPFEPIKHDIFSLSCAHGTAAFNDARRFGSARLLPPGDESWYAHLGYDGLDARAMAGPSAPARLREAFQRNRRWPLKVALLDQRAIAGIGNIYASEICHRLRVHPALPVSEFKAWGALGLKTFGILAKAVEGKGATIAGGEPLPNPGWCSD